jgi:hypothetical protein
MISLRHYATSWRVAGSRPDEMNNFFSIYLILPAAPCWVLPNPGVQSASNRNEYNIYNICKRPLSVLAGAQSLQRLSLKHFP